MQYRKNYQLTYCTNVHPGSDWPETFNTLKAFVPYIRQQVSPEKPFGLGLRLSNAASEELGTGKTLIDFKTWLDSQGLYVFTMNGFPYGKFHDEPVKDMVHAPDWTTGERLSYTKRLFRQLSVLLPEGMRGGISTSPISYRHWHASGKKDEEVLRKGAEHLAELIGFLHDLEMETGCCMHLDIEPEPDGMLENTVDVLNFFREYLEPAAVDFLSMDGALARNLAYKHINLCYDICHFSLAYEDPAGSFKAFEKAGIRIGKIQVSAALKAVFGENGNQAIWESLSRFDEPTYLHQVTYKEGNAVRTFRDLPEVLAARAPFGELRAHFHVPIFLEKFEALHSTQDDILKVLDYLAENPVTEHLEIETYTWDVLPEALKTSLSEGIIREIKWLTDRIQE